MKLICVDPRRTDTAELADLHLPLQPGTDVMLFHGLLHIMLWEGWTDAGYIARHTTGFEALKALVCASARRNGWRRSAASPRRTCSPRRGGSPPRRRR